MQNTMIDVRGIIERAECQRKIHAAVLAARAFRMRRRAAPSPETARERAVRRLSDDMIDVAGAAGCATEDDLMRRGWPLAQLHQYGPAARDIANAAALRRAS